jgi:hypothetical protein
MNAAWIRPAIKDSLISGHPLYLLYSKSAPVVFCACLATCLAEQAMGSVRLQVTGRPPTTSEPPSSFFAPDLQPGRAMAAAAAAPPRKKSRRPRAEHTRLSYRASDERHKRDVVTRQGDA